MNGFYVMPSIKESLCPGAADTDGSVLDSLRVPGGGNTSKTIQLAAHGK